MPHDTATDHGSTAPWRHWLWVGLLAAASVGFSYGFACAVPFAALGTLAALHMARRDVLPVIGVAWLANQLVGFGLLDYPRSANSFAWAAALLAAAVLATLAASAAGHRARAGGTVAATAIAFIAAFAVYELALVGTAVVLSDSFAGFAPLIVGQLLVVNAAALAGLLALHRIGAAAGLAAAIAPRSAAAAG